MTNNHLTLTGVRFSEGFAQFDGVTSYAISSQAVALSGQKVTILADIKINTYNVTGLGKLYIFGTANTCAVNMQGGAAEDPFDVLTLGNVGLNQSYYNFSSNGLHNKNIHSHAFVHDMSQAVNENSWYRDGVLQAASSYPTANNNTGNFASNTLYISRRAADVTQLVHMSMRDLTIILGILNSEEIADYHAWVNDKRRSNFISLFMDRKRRKSWVDIQLKKL
jgi:hypothetical protein